MRSEFLSMADAGTGILGGNQRKMFGAFSTSSALTGGSIAAIENEIPSFRRA